MKSKMCGLGPSYHRLQVLVAAVHAAIRDEAEQVQLAAAFLRVRDGVLQRRVLLELAVADRLVDARDLLVDDAARADVEVPDFGVAHQPARQADVFAARLQRGPRPLLLEAPPKARLRQFDRVALS